MKERDQKRGGLGCAIVGIVLVLLPVLYVLSSGPLAWCLDHDYVSGNSFRVFYYPLICLSGYSPTFEAAWGWYFTFWTQ